MTFSLSRYDGPATVHGVEFAEVHLVESAEPGEHTVVKSWEGTAEVAKREAPEVSLDWATTPDQVEIRLPEGGTGTAFIMNLTLIDGRFWKVDLLGRGASPMA